ncbi:MAG: glycosyltransferase family 39 protein [Oscillospiraceae bacterium]|jgi:hypothetical protein|nr:glycosyltransferase family 39 protein [Oscillospiraceae bacterium]
MTRSGFARFSYYGLAALSGAFVTASLALAPFSTRGRGWALPAGFAIGLCLAFFAPRLSRLKNERVAFAIVIGATLLAGAVWLLSTRVSHLMDFSRMFKTAVAFAEGQPLPDAMQHAMFPHLLGYSFVLSLLFCVFGASVAVAQMFNLFLSLCIAALLFSIGKRLWGTAGGLAAGLLWALLPSHFMLLSLVANEPLHIALTLLAVRIYLSAAENLSGRWPDSLKLWALLGLVVGLSSLIRPVGPVYLLAFALCSLVFGPRGAGRFLRLGATFLAMAAVYTIITAAGAALWEKALDRPVARNGYGWNLYVGMNRASDGGWSQPDQNVMAARFDEGLTAPEIQSLFRQEALSRVKERLREGSLHHLLAEKFARLWSQDSFTVYWLSAGMREDSPLDIRARADLLAALCNLAYGILLACCAFSLFRQLKAGKDSFVLPVTLLIGMAILFILLEANPRYHYAGSAALCLFAAGCVTHTEGGVTDR